MTTLENDLTDGSNLLYKGIFRLYNNTGSTISAGSLVLALARDNANNFQIVYPSGSGGGASVAKVFKVTNAGGTGTTRRVVTGTTYTLSVGGTTAGSSVTLTQDETDVAAIHYKDTAIATGMYFLIYDTGATLPVLDNRSAFLEDL